MVSDNDRPISEKTKISVGLVIAAVVAPLWFFASDHYAVAALAKDRDDLRADVKEIRKVVEEIRVQIARRPREERDHP